MRYLALGLVVLMFVINAFSGGGPNIQPPNFLLQWGGADRLLREPGAVATDGQGNVYVVDRGNNRIKKFGLPEPG